MIRRISVMAALALMAAVTTTRAGMFEGVLDGLRFAGFAVGGGHDDVSNTTAGVIGNVFQGNVVDLGDFDVTLNGPLSAVVQTGGRKLPSFELILSTGRLNVNPNNVVTVDPAQPLSYSLSFDSGLNTTTIDGNLVGDARLRVNRLGGYDLSMQFSDRQTVTVDGEFDDGSPVDSSVDYGPVDIQGNIFADILATITEPLFQAAGAENFFAQVGGRFAREQKSASIIESLQTRLDAGESLTPTDFSTVAGLTLAASILGDDLPDTSALLGAQPLSLDPSVTSSAIPEPATLVLLGGAAALLAGRRHRQAQPR
ncbi:MAG: PEP-CTERM sorting domain-containing protein [Phycisphaerales bacterium]|nr:PEP-CTERM sorting domain-containing protein [Phycisphaerales bacterium]